MVASCDNSKGNREWVGFISKEYDVDTHKVVTVDLIVKVLAGRPDFLIMYLGYVCSLSKLDSSQRPEMHISVILICMSDSNPGRNAIKDCLD